MSTDPEFARKTADIVALYLNPPLNALVLSAGANEAGFDAAVKITGEIRKAKSRAGKSMGTPLAKLEVRAAVNSLLTISGIIDDVANAARVVPGGIVLTGLSEDQAAVADIAVLAEVAS